MKKIGDLTNKEVIKICKSHTICDNCPLFYYPWSKCKTEVHECQDEEIEVEEDDV